MIQILLLGAKHDTVKQSIEQSIIYRIPKIVILST